uniref:Unspecific monooxygenase n=1 Tax=Heterorhabditis bacteriophora TaxID=37862 RepID=A0A1I7XLK2_HETBA
MSLHLLSSYESDGEGDEDDFSIKYEDQEEEVQETEKACGSHGENSSSIKGSFFFGGIDEISSSDEEESSEPSIHGIYFNCICFLIISFRLVFFSFYLRHYLASARKEISRRLPSAALLLNSNKVVQLLYHLLVTYLRYLNKNRVTKHITHGRGNMGQCTLTGLLLQGGTYGVIDTVGETWREHRRFALHQFKNFGLGKNIMEQKIIEEVEAITKSLLSDIKAGSVDIKKAYDVAVGNVINQLLFGYRFDETRIDKFYELKDMMSQQMKDFSHPIASLMFIYPSLRYLPYFNVLLTNYRDRFYSFFDSQILDHEREVDYNLDESTDYVEAYLKEKKRREAVDDEQFSLIQLKNMCLDLWFAGMETTSNTLSWGIIYILNYPDVQVHLHEELDRVIGSGRPVMMADRNLLPYTCAVVNEIQRLANLLPLNLLHQTTRDVNIGGYRISKGMGIVAQISSVLYDEKLFPSPLSFDPSRFMDENGRLKKVEELIPFSIGLRQCLGEGLARMELFLFIANIFNRFQEMLEQQYLLLIQILHVTSVRVKIQLSMQRLTLVLMFSS